MDSNVKDVRIVTGKDPSALIRIVELGEPEPITEVKIREWSEDFSLPTIVRNAFTPPAMEATLFLEEDHELEAFLGEIGEFHGANGRHRWGDLWAEMERGGDAYGSFGTATPNWEDPRILSAIRRLKERMLPPDVFPEDEYAGHVIFGSSSSLRVSTTWHNALDVNLLFQVCGTKEWYSLERLPEGFLPMSVVPTTNTVVKPGTLPGQPDDSEGSLFDVAAHVTMHPGDLLVNPPYSWHSVKVDGMSISMSFRGDKADIVAWLAFRYFDGDIDHPLLAGFANLFDVHQYWVRHESLYRRVRAIVGEAVRRRLGTLRFRIRERLGRVSPDEMRFSGTYYSWTGFSQHYGWRRAKLEATIEKYGGRRPSESEAGSHPEGAPERR